MRFFLLAILLTNMLFSQTNDSLVKTMVEKLTIEFSLNENSFYQLKGKRLPSFQLTTINGDEILSNSLKGKPTVINFWFTNCAPCINEMPSLNELKKKFGNNVNFIAITFEGKDEVSLFIKRKEFNFTHIINAENYINDEMGIKAYPRTLILNKDLKIVQIEKVFEKNSSDQQKKLLQFKNWISHSLNELLN